jgi:hypothetical protein
MPTQSERRERSRCLIGMGFGWLGTLTTAWCVFVPVYGSACTCIPLSAEERFDIADAVFRGEVVSVRPAESAAHEWLRESIQWVYEALGQQEKADALYREWLDGDEYGLLAVIQVHRAWKGVTEGKRVTVRTAPHGAVCGVAFKTGKTYAIYAYKARGLETSTCAGTQVTPIDGPPSHGSCPKRASP